MDTLDDYDLVFKSPGVVLSKDPEQYNCRFTSQMEVFFEAYRDRIIGITGTKGKKYDHDASLSYFEKIRARYRPVRQYRHSCL